MLGNALQLSKVLIKTKIYNLCTALVNFLDCWQDLQMVPCKILMELHIFRFNIWNLFLLIYTVTHFNL